MANSFELVKTPYTSRQRFMCATLGVANTLTLSAGAAMANAGAPMPQATFQPHQAAQSFAASQVSHAASWQGVGLNHAVSNQISGAHGASGFALSNQGAASTSPTHHNNGASLWHSAAQTVAQTAANDLNLSSKALSFLASNLAGFRDITIQVGNSREVINLGSKLTAAEVVAAEQVLATGTQTIKLNSSGTASGGTVTLNGNLLSALDNTVGGTIGSLTISHGVKVIDTLSSLNIGELNNYGSIFTASASQGNSDTLSAGTIVNGVGGRIGSYTGSAASGLYAADPILEATTSVVNSGVITSSGNLTIGAPSVTNTSAQANGQAALISAAGNVNINTQTLTNAGTVQSNAGNLNILSSQALTVDNTGGILQAKSGNLNVVATNADLAVTSGNAATGGANTSGVMQAQNINFKAGAGDVNADVNDAIGTVNVSGNNVHVVGGKDNLTLGQVDATGDPLLADQGTITFTGATTAGQPLTVIAGQNIVSATGWTGIDTSSTTTSGGNVTLVAGANFTGSASTGVTVTNSTNAGKGSATGGEILLTNGPATIINTSSTAGSAGYVQMVAFAGSAKDSGSITLSSASSNNNPDAIIATGSTLANYGDVSIIAGGANSSGQAINIGGNITSRALTMGTYLPTVAAGTSYDNTGKGSNGINSFAPSSTLVAGDVDFLGNVFTTGAVTINSGGAVTNEAFQIFAIGPAAGAGSLDGVAGQNVTINAVGTVGLGNIFAYGGGGSGAGSADGAGVTGGKGGNGGNVTITSSTGEVDINGNINTSGGGGGGGQGGSETTSATAGGSGGIAGKVTLSAASNIEVNVGIYAYDGGAGGAGGTSVGGVGGGGGGGSAVGGGGGGGGGGLGSLVADDAAGGGGGYGNSTLVSAYSGAGGGGALGQGISTGGGGGGSFYGYGIGGGGNNNGYNTGLGNVGGAGGGDATAKGGVGATSFTAGGGGGASISPSGSGAAGGGAQLVAGHGTVNITVGGNATGSFTDNLGTPIVIEASSFTVNASTAKASASILSTSGQDLNLGAQTVGSQGVLNVTTGNNTTVLLGTNGAINVTGTLTGGTIQLNTGATSTKDITIAAGGEVTGPATLNAGTGNITNTAGLIDGTSVNFIGANVTANTNVQTVQFTASGNVAITQGATNVALAASSETGTGKTVSLSAQDAIDITGAVSNTGSSIALTSNTSNITDSSGSTLTATTVGLTASGSIGSTNANVVTNATTDNLKTGTTGSVYLSDLSTGAFTVNPSAASSGTLSVKSAAATFDIVAAPFSTVVLADSNASGQVVLNSANNINDVLGNGGGIFSVNTSGNINANTNNTGIQGTAVNLTSTAGSLGSTGSLQLNTPTANLQAAAGNVNALDIQAATVTGAASPTSGAFTFSSTGSVTPSGVTGKTINITSTAGAIIASGAVGSATSAVTLSGATGITGSAAGLITGATVNLNSSGGDVGSSLQSVNTAAGTLNISATNGSAFAKQSRNLTLGTVSAKNTIDVESTANLTTTSTVSTTNGNITLVGGGNLTVGAAVTGSANVTLSGGNIADNAAVSGSQLNLTATGNITQSGGTLTGTSALAITVGGTAGSFVGPTPINVTSPNLSVTGTTASASANLVSTQATAVNLTGVTLGASGQFQLLANNANSDNTINVTGVIAASSVNLKTGASSVGPDNIALSGSGVISGVSTLNAAGNITSAGTANTISGASANLTAGQAITVYTNVSSLQAKGAGNVSVTDNAATALTIGASSSTGGTFTVTGGQIATTGAISTTNKAIDLEASGSLDIGNTINAGNAGTVTLAGAGITDSGKAVVTGATINLNSSAAIGTSTQAVLTNATAINTKIGSTAGQFVTDSNTGTLTFTSTANSSGQAVLTSSAATLNLGSINSQTVTVNDTAKSANVVIKAGSTVGNGLGAVAITTDGNINGTDGSESISGTSVSLTSTSGSIGNTQAPNLASASVTLNALAGSATVTDSLAATTVTGNANGTFSFTDKANSGTGINLTSPITAANIVLTTSGASDIVIAGNLGTASTTSVAVNSGHNLTLNNGANVQGVTVGLTAANAVNDSGAISGGTINVTATNGSATISKNVTGSGVVTIKGFASSGNAVQIGGTVGGATVNVTGTGAGNVEIDGSVGTVATTQVTLQSGGDLTLASGASVTGTTINLDATHNVSPGGSINGTTIGITAGNQVVIANAITATGTNNSVSISGGAAGQAVVVNGAVSGNTITITGTNAASEVDINASVGTGTTSTVNISAGANLVSNAKATVTGTSISLASTNGNIGSASQAIATKAATSLTINAANGSSYVAQTGDITLGDSKVANVFSFTDTGNLTTGKVQSVNSDVILSATGNLTVGGAVTAPGAITIGTTGSGAVNLNASVAGGTVGITSKTSLSQAAATTISGTSVTLNGTSISLGGTVDGVSTTINGGTVTTLAGSAISGSDIKTVAINGTTVSLGGNVSAANGALTVTATNGYTQTGKLADASDTLNVTGAAEIGGNITDTTLNVTSSAGTTIDAGATLSSTNATIMAPTLTNSGTVQASAALTINAATSVTNNTGAVIGSKTADNTVNITTGSIVNNGSIAANKALNLTASSKDLTITGVTGGFSTASGAALNLQAPNGAITVGDSSNDPFSTLTNLNSFTVNAKGAYTSSATGVTVVADSSGNGGTISINAGSLVTIGGGQAGAYALNANGTTGAGGTIVLNLSGSATSGITVGNTSGDFNISATGTSGGGNVTVTTPGALTVYTANLAVDATSGAVGTAGATVNLTGTKSVLISGNLDTHNGLGNYGDITITTNNTGSFLINGTALTNGQTNINPGQGLAGQNVTINDAGGVTLGAGFNLIGTQSVTINGASLVNNGAITTKSLTLADNGTITLSSLGTGTISNLDTLTVVSATGGINLTSNLPVGAHNINLIATKGAVNFGKVPTVFNAVADSSGNGGSVTIDAVTLTQAGLTINGAATANTNGNGGSVNIDLTGATPLKVTSATGGLQINVANAGTGQGGSVSLITNAALNVDANAVNLGSNVGNSSVTLEANKGVLHVSNATKFDHGLANLTLISNTSSSFTLSGASATGNGLSGTTAGFTLSAGNLTVQNNGGSIVRGTNTGLVATGTLTLSAKKDIGATGTNLLTLSAPTISINALGSAYLDVLTASTFTNLSAVTNLQLKADNNLTLPATVTGKSIILTDTAGGFNAFSTNATTFAASVTSGNLAVTDTNTATVTVNALTNTASAGSASFTTAGALTIAKPVSAGQIVTLSSGGIVTVKGAVTAGDDINILSTGAKGAITESAALTATNGDITLSNAGTGLVNLNALTTAGGTVTVSSTAGAVTVAKALTATAGKASVSGAGVVTVKAAITAGTEVDVAASGTKGAITLTGALTAQGGDVNLSNTSTGTGAIKVGGALLASDNISITSAAGPISVTKALTATTGAVTITGVGALSIKGATTAATDVTIEANGTKGSIAQGANIIAGDTGTISLTANGTGTITDSGAGTYQATAGTINLATEGTNIGTTSSAFRTGGAIPITINVTTGSTGAVNIANKDSASAGLVTLGTANVGSLKFTASNALTTNTGTTDINSVQAATGAILINTSEQTLAVEPASTIATTNGNITLQNSHTGSTLPQINIGDGAVIHGSAILSTNKAAGNVFIAIGTTVPTASTVKAGVTPTPAPDTSSSTTPTLLTYGTKTNLNGSITTGINDKFTSQGRNLSFTTGTATSTASQINVGNNVQITADPPVAALSLASDNHVLGQTVQNPQLPAQSVLQTGGGNALVSNNAISNNAVSAYSNLANVNSANVNSTLAALSNNAVNTAGSTKESTATDKTLIGAISKTSSAKNGKQGFDAEVQHLQGGALLLAPDNNKIVETPFGNVSVGAGSLALLIVSDKGLAIYDLHDNRKGAVSISEGATTTRLAPGRSLIVSKSERSFDEINPAPYVRYRGLTKESALATNRYSADFDLTSMVTYLPAISHMANSADAKTRRTVNNLLKTTVILNQLRTGGEEFAYHLAPQMTAYLP